MVSDGQFGWREDFGWFCVDVRMLCGGEAFWEGGGRGTPPPSYPSLANVIDRDVELEVKEGTRMVEMEENFWCSPTS